METSWVLFLSIYQKCLTLLVTRAFWISCRLVELTIRSFIGLLIICFLECNQSNSKVFCQMPIPYFLDFHREVYWDHCCSLSILMMCPHLFSQPPSSPMRMTVIFTAAKDLEFIEKHVSEDCPNLLSWFRVNELVFYLKKGKTECMIFGTAKRLKEIEWKTTSFVCKWNTWLIPCHPINTSV